MITNIYTNAILVHESRYRSNNIPKYICKTLLGKDTMYMLADLVNQNAICKMISKHLMKHSKPHLL